MSTNNFRGQYSFELDGAPFCCLLNMNSLRMMCKEEKISFSELDGFLSENPFESVPKMIWYGCKNWLVRSSNDASSVPEYEHFCALALDEPGLFERMSEMVTETLGGNEEQKKTRTTRRKAAAKK